MFTHRLRRRVSLLSAGLLSVALILPGIASAASKLPNVKPSFDFPGIKYGILVIDVVLGAAALVCMGFFIAGLIGIVKNIGDNRHGGAGKGGAQMIVSAIALVIILGGGAFLNQLVGFFG